MKNLFAIALYIFTSSALFAQISISDNNYIFSQDRVIYVEDDINLKDNSSRIFLRDESQIIQGSGTTGNSGIGELSVYQDGTVGAHEYNYWCSPISTKVASYTNNLFGISLLNDITGLITSIPATYVHSTDYNGTATPLNIEPYWIWKFVTSDEYAEWVHVEENTLINPGEGFTMKGVSGTSLNNPGDNQIYDFRGKPNNGTIGNPVTAGDWTLVGNPYPSSLDALDYIWDAQNINAITGTLYYWEQDQSVDSHYIEDYVGGYATYTINSAGTVETFIPATFNSYNGDGSLNTVGSSSTTGHIVYRYVPIGHGFMVDGKLGTTGNVYTRNTHREYIKESDIGVTRSNTSNGEPIIEYNENGLNIVPDDYKRFRINVDFNDVYTRQLVHTFHESTSNEFDYGLESKSPEGVASDAYWTIENEPYIAQALPFSEDLTIPIVIKLVEQKAIRIRIFDIQNFDDNQSIYFHDKENDLFVDLRASNYEMNLPVGTFTDRFEITFTTDTSLSINENVTDHLKIIQDNKISKLKVYNPNLIGIERIQVFDINGKTVMNNIITNNLDKYSFSTFNFSSGTYIVAITFKGIEKGKFSKKIVISN